MGVPQFLFGNKLPTYSSRWKHSICISLLHCLLGGHLARFCRVESLPHASRYVVLPDNFPALCIQQEIIFPVGKKNKIKLEVTILCSSLSDWSLHLETVLCMTRTGMCSSSGKCWMLEQTIKNVGRRRN